MISGSTVLAIGQSPGFTDFYGQHALQQEIFTFLKAWPGQAHLGSHLGQFVKGITKEDSKVIASAAQDCKGRCWENPCSLAMHVTDVYLPLLCACVQGRLGEFLKARPHIFRLQNHFVSLVEAAANKQLQQGNVSSEPQV